MNIFRPRGIATAFAVTIVSFAQMAAAQAQQGFVSITKDSAAPFIPADGSNLATWFNAGFRAVIAAGAILAVLRIGYAAYLWAWPTNADKPGNITKAKEVLGDVVLGVLLLLSIVLILGFINPAILNLDALNSIQQIGSSNPQ